MKGSKARKRAEKTKDLIRLDTKIPLIHDTTEIITPEMATEMLKKNKKNRPINWNKVQEYSDIMKAGMWEFHPQGIILDKDDNILTGQKRLWAIIYSGSSQPMRVSRGAPFETAKYIDRGTPQSARDLATRLTDRKHSPMEGSIARAILCLKHGNTKPSTDAIANCIAKYSNDLQHAIKQTKGTKKTKGIYMLMAAMIVNKKTPLYSTIKALDEELEQALYPAEASRCWNKGAAFMLAMEKAKDIVERH